jgi:phosphoribosylamine---glycine ligase
MKFLFLSGYGEGFGLAYKLQLEGHQVAGWSRGKHTKEKFSGIIPRIEQWEDFLDEDTIVVFDSVGGGRTADRLRRRGHFVVGGSVFADELERDREVGLEMMKQAGIKVPPSRKFTKWEKAKEYVREKKERVAFKPSGPLGDELPSYLAYDWQDMIEMLDYYESIAKTKPEFEIQDYVKGVAISTEGWFNGREFMLPFNHTVERKQLMNSDLGPSGGCSGNVVWAAKSSNRIIDEGLLRMEQLLAAQDYVGPIDLNTIVNESGVWGLEFTPRFGYDAMPVMFLELYDDDVAKLFSDLARGTAGREFKMKDGFGGSVRVTVPPYPSDQFPGPEGVPVRGLSKADRPHIYLFDVMLNEKGGLVTQEKITAVFTGRGESLSESLKIPYELAEKVRVPNKQYRTDLREVLGEDFEKFLEQTKSSKEEKGEGV